MTEKRFTLLEKKGYDYCIGFVDNLTGNHLSNWDIMKLANELNDENKELKVKVDFYKDFQKEARELDKENKKLKDENEQLKSAIKDCIIISESNGALSPMRLKSIFYHFELKGDME